MGFKAEGQLLDDTIHMGFLSKSKQSESLLQVYKKRLNWLGYLDDIPKNPSMTAEFTKAVRLFQKDVGIPATGALGKKTFNFLEALIAFETQLERQTYLLSLPEDNPALAAAIRLRLSIFGLRITKRLPLTEALNRFQMILCTLRLPGASLNMSFQQILHFLFNIDSISSGIKGEGNDIFISTPSSVRNKKTVLKQTKTLIRQTAAIELWLYGYDINLKKLTKSDADLNSTLKAFWREAPESSRPPNRHRTYITYKLFKRLHDLQNSQVKDECEVFSQVEEQLTNRSSREEIEKQAQSMISRIWDGVKRVAKFFWSIITGLVKKAVTTLTNTARWLISNARQAFESIKQLYRAGTIGLGKPPKNPNILLIQDFDKDSVVLVSSHIAADEATHYLTKWQLRIQLRSLAIRGFIALFKIMRNLLRNFSAATWLLTLWALSKLKSSFNELISLGQQAVTLIDQYFAIPKFSVT